MALASLPAIGVPIAGDRSPALVLAVDAAAVIALLVSIGFEWRSMLAPAIIAAGAVSAVAWYNDPVALLVIGIALLAAAELGYLAIDLAPVVGPTRTLITPRLAALGSVCAGTVALDLAVLLATLAASGSGRMIWLAGALGAVVVAAAIATAARRAAASGWRVTSIRSNSGQSGRTAKRDAAIDLIGKSDPGVGLGPR